MDGHGSYAAIRGSCSQTIGISTPALHSGHSDNKKAPATLITKRTPPKNAYQATWEAAFRSRAQRANENSRMAPPCFSTTFEKTNVDWGQRACHAIQKTYQSRKHKLCETKQKQKKNYRRKGTRRGCEGVCLGVTRSVQGVGNKGRYVFMAFQKWHAVIRNGGDDVRSCLNW